MKTRKNREFYRFDYMTPANQRLGPFNTMEDACRDASPYDLVFRHDYTGHMEMITVHGWQGAAGTGSYVVLTHMSFVHQPNGNVDQRD